MLNFLTDTTDCKTDKTIVVAIAQFRLCSSFFAFQPPSVSASSQFPSYSQFFLFSRSRLSYPKSFPYQCFVQLTYRMPFLFSIGCVSFIRFQDKLNKFRTSGGKLLSSDDKRVNVLGINKKKSIGQLKYIYENSRCCIMKMI